MSEALMDSLQLTVVAMGIVFAALYALSLLMNVLPKLVGKEKSAVPEPKPVANPAPPSVPVAEPDEGLISSQTVAVIAGALAAYLGKAPENLSVVAIRRVGSGLSPWALSVRRESIQD